MASQAPVAIGRYTVDLCVTLSEHTAADGQSRYAVHAARSVVLTALAAARVYEVHGRLTRVEHQVTDMKRSLLTMDSYATIAAIDLNFRTRGLGRIAVTQAPLSPRVLAALASTPT